jgi:hypothetical protein
MASETVEFEAGLASIRPVPDPFRAIVDVHLERAFRLANGNAPDLALLRDAPHRNMVGVRTVIRAQVFRRYLCSEERRCEE